MQHLYKKCCIVVRFNAKVVFGNAVGGMIVQFHQKSRLHALFPGMITESLAERVAAYMFLQSCVLGSFLDDTECLGTGEMV